MIVDRRAHVGVAHQPLERRRSLAPRRRGDVPARRLVAEFVQVGLAARPRAASDRRPPPASARGARARSPPTRPRQQLGQQRRGVEAAAPAGTPPARRWPRARVRLHDAEQRLVDGDERLQRLLQRRRRPREPLARGLPHTAQRVGRADRRRLRRRIGRRRTDNRRPRAGGGRSCIARRPATPGPPGRAIAAAGCGPRPSASRCRSDRGPSPRTADRKTAARPPGARAPSATCSGRSCRKWVRRRSRPTRARPARRSSPARAPPLRCGARARPRSPTPCPRGPRSWAAPRAPGRTPPRPPPRPRRTRGSEPRSRGCRSDRPCCARYATAAGDSADPSTARTASSTSPRATSTRDRNNPARQRAGLVLDRRRRAHRVARARLRDQRVDLARERGREPRRPRCRRQRARRAFDGRQRARRGQRRRKLRAAGAQLREQIGRHDDRARDRQACLRQTHERPRLAANRLERRRRGPSRTQNVMDAGSLMIGSRPEEGRWRVKGPLLSGALGSAPTLAAVLRWTDGRAPVVVIGPPWLGDAVATTAAALVLVEPDVAPGRAARAPARRTSRAARSTSRSPARSCRSRRAALSALVVENVGGLQDQEATRWLAALVPCLRPGGRLIAADATSSTAAAARVAGAFLVGGADGDRAGVAARRGIVDHWCRADLIRHRGTFRRCARWRRLRTETRRPNAGSAARQSTGRRSRGPTRIRRQPSRIDAFFR